MAAPADKRTSAARPKKAAEQAELEWLRKKVSASLADRRPPLAHDQVMAELEAILEARRKKC